MGNPKISIGDVEYTYSIDPKSVFGLSPRPRYMGGFDPDILLNQLQGVYGPQALDDLRSVLSVSAPRNAADPQVKQLQAQLKSYAEAFQQLKKQAAPYAVVTALRSDKVVVHYAGKTIEAEKPAKRPDGATLVLRPGCTVKLVGDTLQILDVVEDDSPAGEVVQVTRVANERTCEVERAGTSRAVGYSGSLEEGDRVVLDSSGSVVVANLGKPRNDCAVTESTGVTWDDVGGLAEAKRAMREAVEGPVKNADLFARYGKKPLRGVLLYGPPGCGKTMLGKAAATALAELHGAAGAGGFSYVKGPELLNMYVGNTEANIRKLFDGARRHKKKHGYPAIVMIDEADAILGKRTSSGLSLSSTVVPAFLAEMDGLEDSGALVLLATNRPGTLDPAIVRDGRIDRRIKVTRPSREDARDILGKHLRARPLAMDGDEAAEILSTSLFDPALVLYRVRKHSSTGKGAALTLGHMVSGAMLAGGDAGVLEDDLRAAVAETFRQSLDVNHDEEIAEFVEGWEADVASVTRETRRPTVATKGN